VEKSGAAAGATRGATDQKKRRESIQVSNCKKPQKEKGREVGRDRKRIALVMKEKRVGVWAVQGVVAEAGLPSHLHRAYIR
jgi:hypothetical protein